MNYYNPSLKSRARELRKSMTDAEKLLWSKLRLRQLKNAQFYRQKVMGNYIVDYCCPSSKLVVELDGSQHFSEDALHVDEKRDNYLRRMGFKVLRFTNHEVNNNLNNIMQKIYENL